MSASLWNTLSDNVPGFRRICNFPGQLLGISPFKGDIRLDPCRYFLRGRVGRRCRFRIRGISSDRSIFWTPTSGGPMKKLARGDTIGIWTSPASRLCWSPAIRVSSARFSPPPAIAKVSSIAILFPQAESLGRQGKIPCFLAMVRCGDDNERCLLRPSARPRFSRSTFSSSLKTPSATRQDNVSRSSGSTCWKRARRGFKSLWNLKSRH